MHPTKYTATLEQVQTARDAAWFVLQSGETSRNRQRQLMRSELRKRSGERPLRDIATILLFIRLGFFILDWWMKNKIMDPSVVLQENEPWAKEETFTFESNESLEG
jgi:hypothetical protein